MAKTVFLDWQRDSLLLTRGETQGPRLQLDLIALEDFADPNDSGRRDPAATVRRASAGLGSKGPVTVMVARELVELRTLQIPLLDPEDLPDVIRFQAQRQFSSVTDAWVVDYVLLPQAVGQEMQIALVAAMSPAQLSEIETSCSANGLQVERILLRPLEVARLATRNTAASHADCSMVICASESVADILILKTGQVVQVRSTRLPLEPELRTSTMQSEIRRSLIACASELHGGSVSAVALVASETVGQPLIVPIQNASQAMVEQLSLEQLIDFAAIEKHKESLTAKAGSRLAGVAGAILAPGTSKNSIDFRRPKKRTPRKKNTRTRVLFAVAGAAVLLLAAGWYFSRIAQLNAEYEEYNAEILSRLEVGKSAEGRIAELRAIENFLAASPNWLDEVTYIAQKMPSAGQVKLENPSFSVSQKGEGIIKVTVKADDAASITAFEKSIRSPNHIVSGTGANHLSAPEDTYHWRGTSSIVVVGRGWKVSGSSASDLPNPSAENKLDNGKLEATQSAPSVGREEGASDDAT